MKDSSRTLDRSLGLLHATASNMAAMAGIGPFIIFPLVISAMGGPQTVLGWVAGAIMVICDVRISTGLSTSLSGERGSYFHLREAYKRYFGKLIAFMFVWLFLLSSHCEIASGLVGMMHYVSFMLPGLTSTNIRLLSLAAGILTIFLYHNRIKFAQLLRRVVRFAFHLYLPKANHDWQFSMAVGAELT